MARAQIGALKSMQAEWAGLTEAQNMMKYMSSGRKRAVIKQAYMISTKRLRANIRKETPIGKTTRLGGETKQFYTKGRHKGKEKKKRKLKNTVGLVFSKKYKSLKGYYNPVRVGNLQKRGARHQHLVVRGRKGVSVPGRKTYGFIKNGASVFFKSYKAARPKPFVDKAWDKSENITFKRFMDAFVAGMKKESKRIMGKYSIN